jgi:hypothetical protein
MTSRRRFLASAVPAVALAGLSGAVASKALPASIASLVSEFDAALALAVAATARLHALCDADSDELVEAVEDAFHAAYGSMLKAGESLAAAVRDRQPGAMALATSAALYAFDAESNELYVTVNRIELDRIARA